MNQTYFEKLYKKYGNKFWINNPSGEECDMAIRNNAINCTTNPQYCQKLFANDPEYIREVIDNVILKETTEHEEVAFRVYQIAAQRIMQKFMPLFIESEGDCGYVTIQGNPLEDENTDAIMETVHSCKKLSPNYMVKIPAIEGGIQAIEQCVEENIPICATEVFSIAQTIEVCELYEKVAKRTNNYPPFFITHITGIFDDYLARCAELTGVNICPEVLSQAGCIVARKEYRVIKERGYKTTMLGGGLRALRHFTEFVGGDVHVTMNWKDAEMLINEDFPIKSRIDSESPHSVIEELCEKFEVFKQAYNDDGLKREDYASYGPVQLFRNAFLMGWYTLLSEVSKRRIALAI